MNIEGIRGQWDGAMYSSLVTVEALMKQYQMLALFFSLQKTNRDYLIKVHMCVACMSVCLFLDLYPGIVPLKMQSTDWCQYVKERSVIIYHETRTKIVSED